MRPHISGAVLRHDGHRRAGTARPTPPCTWEIARFSPDNSMGKIPPPRFSSSLPGVGFPAFRHVLPVGTAARPTAVRPHRRALAGEDAAALLLDPLVAVGFAFFDHRLQVRELAVQTGLLLPDALLGGGEARLEPLVLAVGHLAELRAQGVGQLGLLRLVGFRAHVLAQLAEGRELGPLFMF